jgi:hypothetical protein
MGEESEVCKVLLESLKERDHSEDWGVGIRMYIREIDWGGFAADSVGSGYGPVAGCWGCGDEHSSSGATEIYGFTFVGEKGGDWLLDDRGWGRNKELINSVAL